MNRVGLTRDPLPDVLPLLADAAAGGVCVFVGTTRADEVGGRAVVALHYEAYEAMAEAALGRLAGEARRRWDVRALVLLHRLGRVGVGEASVVVGVACPHRAAAFEACQWLIDAVKAQVPVWKRDLWDDGTETWTPPNAEWRGDDTP